jgi:glycosyltransferase involved in cell wall biosynthesis
MLLTRPAPSTFAPALRAVNQTRPPTALAPLNVCVLAACPFPANHGTPGSIREMSEAVAALGHEVHIVTYHIGEAIPLDGPILHRIPRLTGESAVVVGPTTRRPLYDLLMVLTALRVIREHRPQLIHAHGYEAGLAAWLCRLATGLPVLYSGHNTMIDELPSYKFIRPAWLAWKLARLLDVTVPRMANRCLPHSTNMQHFFSSVGLRARTDPVAPGAIDIDQFAGGDGSEVRRRYHLGQRPIVLYAGVQDEFQRLDLLLEAMTQVAARQPEAKLLFVVTIPCAKHLERMRRAVNDLGLDERVIFTEPQPLAAIPDFLAACDVAVLSRPQAPGFPMKLLNYMAARRACVLFASSSSTGLIHRVNAYLAEPDTAAALARGILEVLQDKSLRRRLANNGYRLVRERHDRRIVAAQLCASYYRTLEAAGHRRSN